jgi:hypothetical protein
MSEQIDQLEALWRLDVGRSRATGYRMLQHVADRIRRIPSLVCVECGDDDLHYTPGRSGWTLRFDVDSDLVAFCPDCDAGEFDA